MDKLKMILPIIPLIIAGLLAFATVRSETTVNARDIARNRESIVELRENDHELMEAIHRLTVAVEKLNTTIKIKLQ